MIKKILVTIESEDEIDLDEYISAIEDACTDVEGRPMISADCNIEISEFVESTQNANN